MQASTWHLIGWESGASCFNQSESKVEQNQSRHNIHVTFNTRLKTALCVRSNLHLFWLCVTSLCDWLRIELLPLSEPMRSKKAIVTWLHAFSSAWRWLLVHVFASTSGWFIGLYMLWFNFFHWFNFHFPLFYAHCHTLPYTKTKGNKNWTKDKIEPQHILHVCCDSLE